MTYYMRRKRDRVVSLYVNQSEFTLAKPLRASHAIQLGRSVSGTERNKES